MPEITIKIAISDEMVALFEGRDMMVTPLSPVEAGQLAAALDAVHATAQANRKCLSTLQQVIETRGSDEPDIAKTLDMMIEPNQRAAHCGGCRPFTWSESQRILTSVLPYENAMLHRDLIMRERVRENWPSERRLGSIPAHSP